MSSVDAITPSHRTAGAHGAATLVAGRAAAALARSSGTPVTSRPSGRTASGRPSRGGLLLSTLIMAMVVVLAMAAPANAAETFGAGYAASPLRDAAGNTYRCTTWSGGADEAGSAYVPCGAYIYKLDIDGRLVKVIPTPGGLPARRDVAATEDGRILYYIAGGIIFDRPTPTFNPGVGRIVKLVMGRDGNYYQDRSFNVGPFAIGNTYWSPRNLAVDGAGRLYASVNAYVYVFNGRGRRIHAMGGDDHFNGNDYLGGLELAQGLAVSRDGRRVYVVEQRRNHVQRWSYSPATRRWTRNTWRIGNLGAPSGSCRDTHAFSSPYDVALDGSGHLYVLDVTCRRIQKYDERTRAFRGTVWQNYPVTGDNHLYHGFLVDYRGTVIVPEQGRRYVTRQQVARCAPDFDAPVIRRLDAPRSAASRRVVLRVDAIDSCSRVRSIQVQGDVASPHGWIPMRRTMPVLLTAGRGTKRIWVSVRDASGRVSTRQVGVRVTGTQAAAPARPAARPSRTGARRSVSMPGRTRYCRPNPMASLQTPSKYRLLDACATFSATVLEVRTSGTTRLVRAQVNRATARQLYYSATGPVQLWIVSSTRTPHSGSALRVGRSAVFTAALIADAGYASVSAVPTYHVQGT